MRVTHVITRLIVGGAQENTIASVLGLRQKSGLQVNLLSGPSTGPEGSLEPSLAQAGANWTVVKQLVRPLHHGRTPWPFNPSSAFFRRDAPEIVHTHSGKAGILGRLAARRAGVPIIVHTIHGPSFGPFQGAAANWLFRTAERRAGRVTTHFVSVADAMTRQYLAAGIGQPAQYTRIFSGFELEPFLNATNDPQLRARWGLAPEDVVIGMIARLFKLKGHDDLFQVAPVLAKEYPRIKFLLVGDGAWRSRFEAQARALGMTNRFIFTGLVRPEEVPALVGIMDIVAHLSRREGLPRALPQALAAGKPIVATDCDGANEVCFEDETGFLLPAGDQPALERRLLQLADDAGLRARLGARGREFVKARFDVRQMVDALHELYLKLARENHLPAS